MLVKANIPLSIKQIGKMVDRNKITFENAVQRGFEWDIRKQSLFIHSLLVGYPVPPVFARKGEDGSYDMLDGKQRLTTIKRFIDGKFALVDVPPIYYTVDGTEMEMDINGYKYENLDSDIRDDLDASSIVLYYFDGITDEEVAEMFYRLNNGKQISSSTLVRVKALSKDKVSYLGSHGIFKKAMSARALASYQNEDIAIKALFLMDGNDNTETRNVREWIWNTEVDEKLVEAVHGVFTRLEIATDLIAKDNKKLAKKILNKTNLLSLIPTVHRSWDDKIKDAELAEWLVKFFDADGKSVSQKYNDACSGTDKAVSVSTRFSELEKSYNKMFHKGK